MKSSNRTYTMLQHLTEMFYSGDLKKKTKTIKLKAVRIIK